MKNKRTNKTITLGSGYLYIVEYDLNNFPKTIEEFTEFYKQIEVAGNEAGCIQGGAALDYAPEFYNATDDLGRVKKTILQSEDAKLKSGIMTWNGNTLEKLCSTGRVEEDPINGVRLVKIGGVNNQNNKDYVIHFHHVDKVDGDVRVTIVGKNTSGFNLSFAKDKETVIDAEFQSVPSDDEGTLIIYSEEINNQLGTLNVTSKAGTTTGKTSVTVSPSISSGNTYKYKTAASVELPSLGASCTTGYTDWNGVEEISATNGNKLLIVEVNSENKAISAGICSITVK